MVFRSHEASYSDGEDVYIWPFGGYEASFSDSENVSFGIFAK